MDKETVICHKPLVLLRIVYVYAAKAWVKELGIIK